MSGNNNDGFFTGATKWFGGTMEKVGKTISNLGTFVKSSKDIENETKQLDKEIKHKFSQWDTALEKCKEKYEKDRDIMECVGKYIAKEDK